MLPFLTVTDEETDPQFGHSWAQLSSCVTGFEHDELGCAARRAYMYSNSTTPTKYYVANDFYTLGGFSLGPSGMHTWLWWFD